MLCLRNARLWSVLSALDALSDEQCLKGGIAFGYTALRQGRSIMGVDGALSKRGYSLCESDCSEESEPCGHDHAYFQRIPLLSPSHSPCCVQVHVSAQAAAMHA